MVDQGELIDQYRATLKVMKDKLFSLKEEKQRKVQVVIEKQKSSPEFLKLDQSLEILQEGITSLNLEIFKEKSQIRSLKSDSEYLEARARTSEKFKSLNQELLNLQSQNLDLKTEKTGTGDSKLVQLEQTNPKLYTLVKRMIAAEESAYLLKDEISYLEQERNKLRTEYHKYTHALGQEDKFKLKLREIDKEAERFNASFNYFKIKAKDLKEFIDMEKEKIARSGTRDLIERLEVLNKHKSESAGLVDKLVSDLEELENEIVAERNNEDKDPPGNLKYEIKALEHDITEYNKELKMKILEKKKLQNEFDAKLKTVANTRRSSTKTTREGFYKSKHVISKSSACLHSDEDKKRGLFTSMVSQKLQGTRPRELKHFLRNFGSQDQGITTKIVCLNRDEFLKRLKLK